MTKKVISADSPELRNNEEAARQIAAEKEAAERAAAEKIAAEEEATKKAIAEKLAAEKEATELKATIEEEAQNLAPHIAGLNQDELNILEASVSDDEIEKKVFSRAVQIAKGNEKVTTALQAIAAEEEQEVEPEFLTDYWDSYPDQDVLHVTTDNNVFLDKEITHARNHAFSLGTELKTFKRN